MQKFYKNSLIYIISELYYISNHDVTYILVLEVVMTESRTDRFKRLAENRTNELIRRIQILGNCSNRSSYDYTEQQVNKVFAAIDSEVKTAKARFTFTRNKKGFKL
jgi:hypothetical protein